jgi:hypothetical protein
MSRGRDIADALSASLVGGSLSSSGISAGVDSAAVTSIAAEKLQTFDFSDLIGAPGDVGDLIKSNGDGLASWSSDGNAYKFRVDYTGGVFGVSDITQAPTGWSFDSSGTSTITVNHAAGKIVKSVSFIAQGASGHLKYTPAPADIITIPMNNKEDKVSIDMAPARTNADSDQFAYINLVF